MTSEQQQMPSSWAAYQPSDEAPWNLERVVHLHRRAGFAAPWSVLQRDLADDPQAAVDRLLAGEAYEADGDFETMADTIGDAAAASSSPGRLQAWWFYRMLKTPDPLAERLALMWHNHFAASNRKVQDLALMRAQNELFREHARAPFGELLEAVVKQPAMLVWLDADSNRKGHPNENLAREVMELFTLGIGNYSEEDVTEAARALTGWTTAGGRFAVREARHDDGVKNLLGVSGPLDGDDVLTTLLDHPATAQRLAWRICHTLMGEETVDDAALTQLADGLRSRDLNVGWAVEAVLRSDAFFSAANIKARVAGPVEFIVGSLRALELVDPPPSTLLLTEWSSRMGQELFYPPNVGGWKEGRGWLASRMIVARANFVQSLVDGQLWSPTHAPDFDQLLQTRAAGADLDGQIEWIAKLLCGAADRSVVDEAATAVHRSDSERPLATAVSMVISHPANQLS